MVKNIQKKVQPTETKLGANIEAAEKDIPQPVSKIIVKKDVDLVVAPTIKEEGGGHKIHISRGISRKIPGQPSFHSLVFPAAKYSFPVDLRSLCPRVELKLRTSEIPNADFCGSTKTEGST